MNQIKSIPIALISNRDEFRGRMSTEIQGWNLQYSDRGNQIFGPRDEEQKGTWFACENKWKGKWAVLTNIRDLKAHKDNMKSRGGIITEFLRNSISAKSFLSQLNKTANDYNFFNLIFSDEHEIIFFNSKTLEQKVIFTYGEDKKCIFGLSNGTLDSNWLKVSITKSIFLKYFSENMQSQESDYYWHYFRKEMMNKNRYELAELPNTGVSQEMEIFLSSLFIDGDKYGTRSTLFFGVEEKPAIFLYEQTYTQNTEIEISKKIRVQYEIS